MKAAVAWGILVTLITETLSLFHQLTMWSVAGCWAVTGMGALVLLRGKRRHDSPASIPLTRSEIILLATVAAFILVQAVIVWFAPPNTADSLTYHLSRVEHWMQNRGVAHYPTHILRQLYRTPWSEFAILHLEIVGGGDRLAGFVQWFAMLGSLAGVSLLAREFGADRRGQIFATTIAAALPMGILQATSTQTDYVVSLWLVCFVWFGLVLVRKGDFPHALATGFSLGLAILTKVTAYIYAFPFVLWIGWSILRSRHRQKWLILTTVAVFALAPNIGYFARNHALYGNPRGPAADYENGGFKYANDIFTASSCASNLIRSLALHFGTFAPINRLLNDGIGQFHRWIGLDASDPRTTWGYTAFQMPVLSAHEDDAGNLWHTVLVGASLPFLFQMLRRREKAGWHGVCVLTSLVALCLYLKWAPWNSRLHLPAFILWSPVAGLFLSRLRQRQIAEWTAGFLLLAALPWLFCNKTRPLLGRENIFNTPRAHFYFSNCPELETPMRGMARFVVAQNCRNLGLIAIGNDYEYPLWAMLRENGMAAPRIEHILVSNISQTLPASPFVPCAVIMLSDRPPPGIQLGAVQYSRQFNDGPVSVFMR